MLTFLIISLLLAVAPLVVRTERATNIIAGLFFTVNVAAIGLLLWYGYIDRQLLYIFRADGLAVLFHLLMTLVLGFSLLHSSSPRGVDNIHSDPPKNIT